MQGPHPSKLGYQCSAAVFLVLLLILPECVCNSTAWTWDEITWKQENTFGIGVENTSWMGAGGQPYGLVSSASKERLIFVWEYQKLSGPVEIYAEIRDINSISTSMLLIVTDGFRPVVSVIPETNYALICWQDTRLGTTISYVLLDLLNGAEIQRDVLGPSVGNNLRCSFPSIAPYFTKDAYSFSIVWIAKDGIDANTVVSTDLVFNSLSIYKRPYTTGKVMVSSGSVAFRSDKFGNPDMVTVTTVFNNSIVAWSEIHNNYYHSICVAVLVTQDKTTFITDAQTFVSNTSNQGFPSVTAYAGQAVVRISWDKLSDVKLFKVLKNKIKNKNTNQKQTIQIQGRKWVSDPIFWNKQFYYEVSYDGSTNAIARFRVENSAFEFTEVTHLAIPQYMPTVSRISSTLYLMGWIRNRKHFLRGAILNLTRLEYPTMTVAESGQSEISDPQVISISNAFAVFWLVSNKVVGQIFTTLFRPVGVSTVVFDSPGIRNLIVSTIHPQILPAAFLLIFEEKGTVDNIYHNYFVSYTIKVVDDQPVFHMTGTPVVIGGETAEQRNTKISAAKTPPAGFSRPYSHVIVWEEIQSDSKTYIGTRLVLVPGTALSQTEFNMPINNTRECQRSPVVTTLPATHVNTHAISFSEYSCNNASDSKTVLYICTKSTAAIRFDISGQPVALASPSEGKYSGELWVYSEGFSSHLYVTHTASTTGGVGPVCYYTMATATLSDMWYTTTYNLGSRSVVFSTAAGTEQKITIEGGSQYSDSQIKNQDSEEHLISVWIDDDTGGIRMWSTSPSFPFAGIPVTDVPVNVPTGAPFTALPPTGLPIENSTSIPTLSPTIVPTEKPAVVTTAPVTNIPTTSAPNTSIPDTDSPTNDTLTPDTNSPTITPAADLTRTKHTTMIVLISLGVACCLTTFIVAGIYALHMRDRRKKHRDDLETELIETEGEMWRERTAKVSGSSNETSEGRELLVSGSSMDWVTIRPLGSGTFGTVVLGMSQVDGSLVAVKSVAAQKELTVRNLCNEIKRMTRLSHPNIIKYIGEHYDTTKGIMNIIMEFIEGGSLHQMATATFLSEQTVSHLLKQVLEGLRYVHSCGIIHRDIKGANLLCTKEGRVVVADFGCSRDDSQSIGTTTFAGTPPYIAPEVILTHGTPAYTQHSDIWAFGCTIVELLNKGKPPWPEFDTPWGCLYHMMTVFKEGGVPKEIPVNLTATCRNVIDSIFVIDAQSRPTAETLLLDPFFNYSELSDSTEVLE